MPTRTLDRILIAFEILVVALVGLIGVYATYDVHSQGEIAPKNLKADYLGTSNPLRDLSDQGDNLSIIVRSRGRPVNSLWVAQTTLTNTGSAPIMPADIAEPITITSARPWRIVHVANYTSSGGSGEARFEWERQSETQFRARPALINPGDMIWVRVYLTRDDAPSLQSLLVSPVNWNTRIVNMRNMQQGPDLKTKADQMFNGLWLFTMIWGWGIVFLIFSFALYHALTVLLLGKLKIIDTDRPVTYLWLVPASMLNLIAAEAGTTYVFGGNPVIPMPPDHIISGVPLALNTIMILILWVKSLRKRRRRS